MKTEIKIIEETIEKYENLYRFGIVDNMKNKSYISALKYCLAVLNKENVLGVYKKRKICKKDMIDTCDVCFKEKKNSPNGALCTICGKKALWFCGCSSTNIHKSCGCKWD